MLRYVFRLHRKRLQPSGELEDWVQYVQNSAQRVDQLCQRLEMIGWIETYRIRKWRFAGELARKQDSRWSQQAVQWRPNGGVGRSAGAPPTRWEDQLLQFAGGDWMAKAQDAESWAVSEDVFATWNFLSG